MRNDASPDLKIVLIGPMSAGKSTVAETSKEIIAFVVSKPNL